MKIIALEEHVLPRDIAEQLPEGVSPMAGVAEALDDLGEGRLRVMDEAGVDVQVLSATGHGLQQLPPADARRLSAETNERMAATVATHPDRFRAFATLPMSDPDAAAAELRRTVAESGFVGAMIHGQTHGVWLDHPSVDPVLAAAEELGVPLYLHPAVPPPAVAEAYFGGLEPGVGRLLATAGWGWHAECGMHVLRMVVAGVFERHPGLRLIVGHMGENLPFSLARADERLSPACGQPVMQTVLDHVVITTSGYFTDPPLLCALMVFGIDRMLFSVDHPFSDSRQATAWLADVPLNPDDRERLAHANATRVLGL